MYGGEFYNGSKTFVYHDLYRCDVEKNEWKMVSSPNSPPPRSAHQIVAWKNNLYMFGWEFTSPNQERFHHYKYSKGHGAGRLLYSHSLGSRVVRANIHGVVPCVSAGSFAAVEWIDVTSRLSLYCICILLFLYRVVLMCYQGEYCSLRSMFP